MKRKVDPEESDAVPQSPSAAAFASFQSNEERESYDAIEKLVSIFNFDRSTARKAVEAAGSDLTKAYNWIFDQQLAEDEGGPVVPKEDCLHVYSHVLISPTELQLGQACGFFEDEGERKSYQRKGDVSESCASVENWICLECNATRCSRYISGHCKDHWLFTRDKASENNNEDCIGHCIAVSVSDLSVWCYECDSYIRHPLLKPYTDHLQRLKFGCKEEDESSSKVCNDDNDFDSADDECTISRHPYLPTNLRELATFILSDACKSIAVLAGAGMSRASGSKSLQSR